MIRINQIKIPVQKDETSALKKKIQKTLRTNHPYTYQIVRKSLDARDKGFISIRLMWNLNDHRIFLAT